MNAERGMRNAECGTWNVHSLPRSLAAALSAGLPKRSARFSRSARRGSPDPAESASADRLTRITPQFPPSTFPLKLSLPLSPAQNQFQYRLP